MLLSRRAAIKGLAAAGLGTFSGAAVYGVAYERHQIGVTQVVLPVSGLPSALDGLRVGFLTDIHHSQMVPADDVAHAVQLTMAQTPDVVVLGGDYVTFGDRAFVEPVAELLAPLRAPYGVFAILGNHDDDRDMPAALEARHIEVLKDARTSVRDPRRTTGAGRRAVLDAESRRRCPRAAEIGRAQFCCWRTTRAESPKRRCSKVPAVLSGHTHGGQVVIPGLGAVARRRFPVLAGLGSRGRTRRFSSAVA